MTNDIAASARNQASVTRDQMIASQRPWVGPDFKESPIHIGNADEPVRWRVYFKNGGSSPALKVQWHVRLFRPSVGVDYTAVQKEIEMLPMDPKMSFFLLNGDEGPNVSHSQVNGIDVTLGQDNLAGIFRRTMTLALGGRVIYSDEFEGSHETTFCVTYLPPTERAPESWQYCPVNPVAK